MRNDLDNPHLQKADALGLYDRFVRMAVRRDTEAYCDKLGRVIHLKRGQCWISTNDLEAFCSSRKRGRTILKQLKMGHLIGHEAGQGITVITICNYDEIQNNAAEGARDGANQRANEGPGRGQQNGEVEEIKEDKKGLGHARARETEPLGHDPPPTQPDQENFVMTAGWTMTTAAESRLVARFEPELGTGPFWRQVERFIRHHCDLGTVDTQQGFDRSLEGWLRCANANREDDNPPLATNGHANGSASGGNGHDPPKITSGNFEERAIYIFERAIEDSPGARKLNILEKSEVRIKARKIWAGENIAFGLERFELCSADGLRSRIAQMGRRIAVPSNTKPAREQDQQC